MDSIRVAIRVRPTLKREHGCKLNWLVEDNTIFQLSDGKKVPNGAFTFDRIFDKDMTTVDLYMDFAKPIVLSVMEGINGTLFAYGQTASGKTYTMTGDLNTPGVIPHALGEVFDYINETENREFLLRVSYMEIYNEVITDLLKPKHTNLKIHENADKEVFVGDLTEKVVTSVEEIIDLMKIGERHRHFGCTNMNEKSSRSHTIFRMVIESRETSRHSMGGAEVDGAVKVSHLNLVDLAGSERASATGAEGIRLREGGFINKSLFALGNVINKLSEGESTFVPFRDSRLTRILQTSLGGNAKTSIICAVTPASTDETLSTLQFANRAKTIKNRPEVNEVLDETTLLKRYRRELNDLKKKLEQFASKESMMELQMEKDKMEQLLQEQREVAAEQREKIRELANFFCTAQPKEEYTHAKRNKRRWTVCPMDVQNKPALHLDLASSFDHDFMNSNKRLKPNGDRAESFRSESMRNAAFNKGSLDRFFADIDEREEDIEESMEDVKNVSVRRSGSLGTMSQEKRYSLAENVVDERIGELEMELKRMTNERDGMRNERDSVRNDLSDNITASCEVQEDLVKTKQSLREKKQKIRELQQRLDEPREPHPLSCDNPLDKRNEEEQISLLKESLSKERELHAIAEVSFGDLCSAKEDVEKDLMKSNHDNEALRAQLQTAGVAKDEAANECQRLRELTQELESKLDVLTVVQSELEAVDGLQEELLREQERNNGLEEELRKNRKDSVFQRNLADLQETAAQTTTKFDEAIEKLQLLEGQNSGLRFRIEELIGNGERSEAAFVELTGRVQELQDENASLIAKDREMEEKCFALQEEIAENSTLVVDLKTSMAESAKTYEERVNEKAVEVSELQKKMDKLASKLARKRRRASCHSTMQTDDDQESDLTSLVDELEQFSTKMKDNVTRVEDEAEVVKDDKDSEAEGMLAGNKVTTEELVERNSLLVQDLEDLKQELQCKCKTVEDLEAKLETKMSDGALEAKESLLAEQESSKDELAKMEAKLKEALEAKEPSVAEQESSKEELAEMEIKLNEALEAKESSVAEQESSKEELAEMEVKLNEALEAKESLLAEQESSEDELAEMEVKLNEALKAKESSVAEQESSKEELAEMEVKLNKALEAKESSVAEQESSKEQLAEMEVKLNEALEAKESLLAEQESSEDELTEMELKLNEALEAKESSVAEQESSKGELAEMEVKLKEALEAKESSLAEQESSKYDEEIVAEVDGVLERANSDVEEGSERVNEELKEVSREVTELQRQLKETLEESEERMADIQRKFDEELELKEGQLEEKIEDIASIQRQLDEALFCRETFLAERKEPASDTPLHFDEELGKKSEGVEEKCEEVVHLQIVLEEERTGRQSFIEEYEERVVQLRKNFDEELERKSVEIEEKYEEIVNLQRLLKEESTGRQSSIDEHEERVVQLRTNFDDELERKSVEIEEKYEEIINLQRVLEEERTERQSFLKEHEERVADLQQNFDEELERKTSELQLKSSEFERLQKQLEEEQATVDRLSEENAVGECGLANIRAAFKDDLERKNAELLELQDKLQQALSSNEQLRKEHEHLVGHQQTKFHDELGEKDAELEEQMSAISELRQKLEHAISSEESLTDGYKDEIAELQKTFEEELQQKNTEVSGHVSLCKTLEEKLQALVQCHETDIASLKSDFDEEQRRLHGAADETCNAICELEEKLKDTIAARDLMAANHEEFENLRKELDLELQRKDDVINEDQELIGSLKEQMTELKTAMEDMSREHDDHVSSIRKELSVELENMETSVKEKSRLCAKLEDEIAAVISAREGLVREHEIYIDGLKEDFRVELERVSAVLREKSCLVDDLQIKITDKEIQYEESIVDNEELGRGTETLISEVEKMTEELVEKTSQMSGLELEHAEALKMAGELTGERDSLVGDYQSLQKQLGKTRVDLETKSGEVAALERKVVESIRTSTEENNIKQDKLQRTNECLEGECEKLKEQVLELLGQKMDGTAKDERTAVLIQDVEQLAKDSESTAEESCGSCRRRSSDKGNRRESLMFKSMLEDIKEEVKIEKEDTKQSKLVDELSYTLIVTQETLEQKEFVIDEQSIEISEKDTLVEDAEEKLRKSQEFAATQETKLAELHAQIARESSEMTGWKTKVENAEAALEKTNAEMEELQVKVKEYESILSEEQLKELYYTMEEKGKRIAELEEELGEKSQNDQKICELEMDLEVLHGEVSYWKTNSEEAESGFKDLKGIIKEQEKHIVELESLKVTAKTTKIDEHTACELDELREQLKAARASCDQYENEKTQGLKVVQETNRLCEERKMELEVLRSEVNSWKSKSDEARGSLKNLEETVTGYERHVAELETKDCENEQYRTCEFEDLRKQLKAAKSRLDGFEKEKVRGLKMLEEKNHLLDELEQEVVSLQEELEVKVEELKEVCKLEQALWEGEEREMQQCKAAEEMELATKTELNDIRDAHHAVSDELDCAKKQLSNQSATLVEIRNQLTQAEKVNNEELEKRRSLEKIIDQQQAEVHKKKMEENEAQQTCGYLRDADQGVEKLRLEMKKKEEKIVEMKERLEYLEGYASAREKELERALKVIDELEAEEEEHLKKIKDLEGAKTRHSNPTDGQGPTAEIQRLHLQLKENEEKVMEMKEQIKLQEEHGRARDEEYKRVMHILDKMDGEMEELENKNKNLKLEKEALAKCKAAETTGDSVQHLQEVSSLKSRIKILEADVDHLRDSSRVNLEEELKKLRNDLKTKELDLYHVTHENTKQLDCAKSKIREMEKECASYSRKNNELRTEIRRLHSQDNEPTIDVYMNKPQRSQCDESVGVIGSVALFTLDAKLAKLQEDYDELKEKSETLQKKNDALNVKNLDLVQRHSQVSEKYYKLKGQYAINAEARKLRDNLKPIDNSKPRDNLNPRDNPKPTDNPKPRDKKPPEPIQHTKELENQLQFCAPSTSWAVPSVKESHTLEKTERKPARLQKNKENLLLPTDKPGACKNQ